MSSSKSSHASPFKEQESNGTSTALVQKFNMNSAITFKMDMPLLMEPSLSEPERKAMDSWEKEMKL